VYAPTTVTTAETFIWYRATPRLTVGVAHLWKQNAFRVLGSYQLGPETMRTPSVNASVGVQGIGTGNPGYSLTAEKNLKVNEGTWNAFVGAGWRSNENHAHMVGGAKFTWNNQWTLGIQSDGHAKHPFVTYSTGPWIFGAFLVDAKSPALMVGVRF
jgi:hypothetical protein